MVLIGILGSLSIALQASAPQIKNDVAVNVDRATQVAQVSGSVTTPSQKQNKDEKKEPAKMRCFAGFDYYTRTKDGKVTVDCFQEHKCSNASFSNEDLQAAEKAGATKECLANMRSPQRIESDSKSPQCSAATECPLYHCFPLKGREECVKVNGTFTPDDGGFAPKNNEWFALRELARNAATDPEQAKLLQEINQSAGQGLQKGIQDAFKDAIIEQEMKVSGHPCADITNHCLGGSDLQKKYEEEQKKLEAMKAMQTRLAKDQTGEVGPCLNPPCSTPPTTPTPPTSPTPPTGSPGPSGGQQPSQQRQGSTFPPQQQQQNPYQQCSPQYFCQNNALYWGSPQQQQQQQPQYNFLTGSYTYPPQCQNQQNQFVQACQYGCAQPQGGQFSTQCAQNPQQNQAPPVASLTCGGESALYDIGVSVPITFSCTNAVSSTGSGFSTGGALSGSASPVVAKPPAGADIVSYGLTCTASNNQTASKRCDARINVTSIVMVANPKEVRAQASTTIGWVSRGMKTCVISSPDAPQGSLLEKFNDDNRTILNVSGIAVTPPLTTDTDFLLSCVTKADQQKSSRVRVKVSN